MTMHRIFAAATLVAALLMTGVAMADERTITVGGQGEITALPDRALVRLGVEARGSDRKATQREVDGVVRDFIAAAKDLGIQEKHIKTAQLSIRPEYDWSNKTSKRRLIGYFVHRSLEVNLEDLSMLGLLLEQATDLGVNQAQPPEFKSSRKDDLMREALANAAQNARLNADVVARTLDAEVGKARNISTTNVSLRPPPVPRMMAMESRSSKGSGAADTYTAGEIKFSAEVTVEFDLIVD